MHGVTIIIGRNLLTLLGIISGLPHPSAPNRESVPDDSKARMAPEAGSISHIDLHPVVVHSIQRNQSIPANSFCNLQEAVVFLESGDAALTYCRQNRIDHSIELIVDAQISDWLRDGKITLAPH